MAFELMLQEDQRVIGECLLAAPFFLDDDLGALVGIDEDVFQGIAESYPEVSDGDEDVSLCIHGALLNIMFYPHRKWGVWDQYISVTPHEIPLLHKRWMALMGWDIPEANSSGELYFKLMK